MARVVISSKTLSVSSVAEAFDTSSTTRVILAAFKPHDVSQSSLIAIGTSSAVTVATGFTFSSVEAGNMEMELLRVTDPIAVPSNTFWAVSNDTTAQIDFRFIYEN